MVAGVELSEARAPEIEHLPAAPLLPEDDPGQNTLTHLLPLTGVLGSVTMVVGLGPAGAGGRGLLMAGALIASTGAMAAAQVLRQRLQRRRTIESARHEHLHRLSTAAARLSRWATEQREVAHRRWPHPTTLVPTLAPTLAPEAVAQPSARRLDVRIGCSDLLDAVRIVTEPSGPGVADPVCREALARFAEAHRTLRGLPTALPLDRLGRLEFLTPEPGRDPSAAPSTGLSPAPGDTSLGEAAVRALLLSAARAHPSDRLSVAVLCTPQEAPRWDWCKWLPHADPVGATAPLLDHRAAHLVARVPHGRHLLLVVTPAWSALHPPVAVEELPPAHTVVSFGPPRGETGGQADLAGARLRLTLTPPRAESALTGAPGSSPATHGAPAESDGASALGSAHGLVVDLASLAEATATARRLSRRHRALVGPPASDAAALALAASPAPRTGDALLRALIGTDLGGAPVHLDLKEAALGGHGPHGLLVGATGSGKSELLRTLITSLVATHVPDDLALVLVDFKGGATFADVADLPHVAACVTNLADDVSLVDRMQDALSGEMERRQELLRAHGHPSIVSYREARRTGGADATSLPELPHLMVCVDEFSELLAARPAFLDLFTAIGRLGRSLGIHLLLASQRLDDGRLHALEAHLSYRIALRTFSAQESRSAIGVPDAHTLPRRPGAGVIRTGADELRRFDALHLGAPLPHSDPGERTPQRPSLFTALARRRSVPPGVPTTRSSEPPPTLDRAILRRTREAVADSCATRRIWLPPLEVPVSLGDLLAASPAPQPSPSTALRFPIGLLDLPREQRHAVWELDLSGAQGHVAVVGAPRSGRSTALQTLVCAWAHRQPPSDLHLHLVDLVGGALSPLADLPHTVSHTTRDTAPTLDRLLAHLDELLRTRELDPGTDASSYPRTVVVVDGWGTLRAEHPEIEERLVALAPRALAVGLHLVFSALHWNELRAPLLDAVGSRVELRLGDPFDSLINRRSAASVPHQLPGRGIARDGVTSRVALPILDTSVAGAPHAELATSVRTIASTWPGPAPARWRDVPTVVEPHELAPATVGALRLGLDDRGTTRTHPADAHLVITGPPGSGRSSTLRHELDEWLRATAGQVLLIDPRATWSGVVPEEHLLAHLTDLSTSGDVLTALAARLSERLPARLPGRSVDHPPEDADTPGRSAPPPVTVLIDDLDLCRDLGADLGPLVPLLPRATALGLRVVTAGRDRGLGAPDRWSGLLFDLGATRLTLSGLLPGRAVLHQRGSAEVTLQLCRPRVPTATH